ncbi:TPA: RHS repeat domain-containing protein [Providencia stuartii]
MWNTQNQLIRCFTPSGDVWRYTYDAFGRRLSKTKTVDNEKHNAHPAFPALKPRVTAWHYLWSGDQMALSARGHHSYCSLSKGAIALYSHRPSRYTSKDFY